MKQWLIAFDKSDIILSSTITPEKQNETGLKNKTWKVALGHVFATFIHKSPNPESTEVC